MLTFLVLLLLIFALGILIILACKVGEYRRQANQAESELGELSAKCKEETQRLSARGKALEAQNQRLSKYVGIANADEKAAEILSQAGEEVKSRLADAHARAQKVVQEANAALAKTKDEAAGLSSEAKQKAKVMKEEARYLLDAATLQAGRIVENANKRAEEVAGSAYEAKNNAELYERTAKAMKNMIEGYGDQYIKPGHSLLDDLAQEVGYAEAGQELKNARERSNYMIRNATAASCDYVEATRRQTAIDFVLDAFNGKVDSILSRVRHDNAGTLEQEIRDAFTLVNFNGSAFRSAHVTEEYLVARLDELKWAAIAQQLKLEEREEQRRIKEQLREEEKARKEYERVIQEAAKDEEMLRKAMERAQQKIDEAKAEQRAEYEEQLQELAQRLKEAEERNQRAISMAQQTKRGYVYIISNIGSFGENVYKVGLTRRLEPLDRVRELGDSSVPFEFDVHALILSDDAPALECQLHRRLVLLQINKVNHRKEFFQVTLQDIRKEVETLGITAHWTMTAEAREYKETLAIEKAMKINPALRDAWVARQLEMETVRNQIVADSAVGADA